MQQSIQSASRQQRLANALDGDAPRGSLAALANKLLLLLILLNVTAVILESVQSLYQPYQAVFRAFEWLSVIIFTIEYGLRVWSAPKLSDYQHLSAAAARWRYLRSPMAVIDLLAIAPFYLSMLIALDLRFLRALRLLRLLKFTRHSRALQLLATVLKTESSNLFAAFSVLFVLLILASSGMYFIESDVQPEHFSSIPAAMWWAMATLTTVGYGDVTPITTGGRVFGGMITIIGMGMVALPAGILASGFAEQLSQRRQNFKVVVMTLLEKAHHEPATVELIESLRKAMQIDSVTAKRIIDTIKRQDT